MDNDHRLDDVSGLARGLRHQELEEERRELHSLNERRGPEAEISFTEAELRWLVDELDKPMTSGSTAHTLQMKLRQALHVETGRGGRFA